MAVPKNRLSQTRQKRRRANWKLTAPGFVECPQCHEAVMPHHVCPTCGSYTYNAVLNIYRQPVICIYIDYILT